MNIGIELAYIVGGRKNTEVGKSIHYRATKLKNES